MSKNSKKQWPTVPVGTFHPVAGMVCVAWRTTAIKGQPYTPPEHEVLPILGLSSMRFDGGTLGWDTIVLWSHGAITVTELEMYDYEWWDCIPAGQVEATIAETQALHERNSQKEAK